MANLLDGVTEDQRDDSTEGLGRIMIYRDPAPEGDNLVPTNGNRLTQAVAPEPQGDLASNIAKLRELVANFGTGILDQLGVAGMQPGPKREAAVTGRNAMLGVGDEQSLPWPQRMIRSGATLPGDVASGEQPVIDPFTGRTSGRLIERTQDLAGLAGGGALTERPGVATLGSGPTRPNIGNVAMKPTESAPVFYSALEHAVENSTQNTATPEQWAGFLKNTPGVKAEEIQWTGIGDWLAGQKGKVSKDDVKAYLDEHKVELKDVTKTADSVDPATINDIVGEHTELWADGFHEEHGRPPNRQELQRARQEIEDDVHNDPASYDLDKEGSTKYSSYQLPGGENYREHLLTMPKSQSLTGAEVTRLEQLSNKKKLTPEEGLEYRQLWSKEQSREGVDYKSSHWDEPNVLAHVRTNDRMMPGETPKPMTDEQALVAAKDWVKHGGEKWENIGPERQAAWIDQVKKVAARKEPDPVKSLHIEEIQSDWHQQGRKQGYDNVKMTPEQNTRYMEIQKKVGDTGTRSLSIEEKRELLGLQAIYDAESQSRKGVPDAPFKTTWPELALKRMIRHAAENGYDRISWTPGEAQAARYDLSKHYQDIRAYKKSDGKIDVWGRPAGVAGPRNAKHIAQDVLPERLSDIVGKELADKIANQQPEFEKTYSGVDLKVGGEGMREFYDKMLPKMAEKIGKAHGVKVKTTNLPEATRLSNKIGEAPIEQPVHYFDLPQSLRKYAVGKGFPLYLSSIPFPLTPVDYNPFEKKNK